MSLADLQKDEVACKTCRLITEDAQGINCLTNFHGMELTRDKMCSMVRKGQTTTGARVDVETTDEVTCFAYSVLVLLKKFGKASYAHYQQLPSNPGENDGNHDPRGAND